MAGRMLCGISDGPEVPEDVCAFDGEEEDPFLSPERDDGVVLRNGDTIEFTTGYPAGTIAPVKRNPKLIRALKDGKAPLEHLVTSVWPGDARVHKLGADKYGRSNWLIDQILASTYKGAMLRHLKAWAEGEDIDPESGESHLYHIRACCAIVLDSDMKGTLVDDRLTAESKDQA